MNKAVFLAAALALTPLPALGQQAPQAQDQPQGHVQEHAQGQRDESQRDAYAEREGDHGSMRDDLLERLSKSELRDRLASAVERIENACSNDIERYCGDITPGGGRIASCMQAYADQLSLRCRFSLGRAVSNFERAVENIADTCMSAVQQQCGDVEDVRQCIQQKSASLPQSCQTIVAAATHVRQALAERAQSPATQEMAQQGQQGTATQGQQGAATQGAPGRMAALRGMPVFSSDGKNLGQIIQVERAPDGKIQSVQIQVGRLLGLGEKVITIDGDKIEQLADRMRLLMNSNQIRSLPETRTPGAAQR